MAIGDPTTSTTTNTDTAGITAAGTAAQVSADQIRNFSTSIQESQNGINILNQQSTLASTILNTLNKGLTDASTYFKNSTAFTREQANMFDTLGVAVMGASKAFTNMTDNSNVSNFSSQLNYLVESATNSANPLVELTKLAKEFGLSITPKGDVKQRIGDLATALKSAAVNVGQGADGALKLQNAYFQLMATSGQLGSIWDSGSEGLADLNSKLSDQSKLITSTYGATGVAIPVLGQYYQTLGKIPGALSQIVQEGGDANKNISLFQAAIELANGTGRDFQSIVNDMSLAFENYGKTGNDALLFTARMTGQANNFGIRIDDVKGFMDRMSDSFKMLGDNAEGTSKIFSEFFGQLRNTGLGVKPSIEILEQMTGAMSKMSTAQQAFLSSRTGGPGGLLGAVQIERQLREGQSEQVFSKIRESLMQQFGGKIVTQGQVQTQAEASQFERQRQLLQSGAFGNIAGNKDQATRLLEALAAGPNTKAFKEGTDLLRQTTEMGVNIEQKSLTQLVGINKALEEIKQQGGIVALNFAQNAFGAGGGNARNIQANVVESSTQGATAAVGVEGDKTKMYSGQAFGGLLRSISETGTVFESAMKASKATFVGKKDGETSRNNEEYNKLIGSLESQRSKIMQVNVGSGGITESQRKAALSNIDARENQLRNALAQSQNGNTSKSDMVGQAAQVASATLQAHQQRIDRQNISNQTNQQTQHIAQNRNIQPVGPDKLDLVVNVNIDGKKIMQSHQIQALNNEPISR